MIAVIIATKGRVEILVATLKSIWLQTQAVEVYLAVASVADSLADNRVTVVLSPPGSSSQRNQAIRQVPPDVEYIAFFDDDVELHPSYLRNAIAYLERNPEVVAVSGKMLVDGGISRAAARKVIEEDRTWMHEPCLRDRGPYHLLYGCNMVARSAPLRATMFDENLPGFGYNEDYDLSIRLKEFGRVGRLNNCVGVHLQVLTGRVCGRVFGYAFMANNWYLLRKGVCHVPPPWSYVRFVAIIVFKRMFNNLRSALSGQLERDPWGQLHGNLLALCDILRGRCSPMRILEF
jgi:glycosyltransferase involved in cell wall biosynthesis